MAICGIVRKFASKFQEKRQLMKRLYILSFVAFCVLALCTSCLKGNDAEVGYYNDTAISSFTLGTLNQYKHTTSSTGEDSVYKVTLTGSAYHFCIDQMQRRIYNPDSLPVGTDIAHVICTLNTYNNGVPFYESLTYADSLTYYASSDSIDFSKPRKVRVYAYSADAYSTYTITVNVHQQQADDFEWVSMTTLSGNAQQAFADKNKGKEEALAAGMKLLIGHSTTELYALSTDNLLMVSADEGRTWTADRLDDAPSLLPTDDIACVSYPYSNSAYTDYVLMIGNRNGESRMWHKIVDYAPATLAVNQWAFMEEVDNNLTRRLPSMTGLSLVRYDSKVLAFGLSDQRLKVYESKDSGLTWMESTTYALPGELNSSAPIDVVVDTDNCLWIVQEATGQIWRGRLNRLGWK